MSLNRKVVVWQSETGLWNIASYDFYHTNQDSDDFDSEWDVEYTDDFNFTSIGHQTEDAADAAWQGANHGGAEVYQYCSQNKEMCAKLDEKAKQYLHEEEQASQRLNVRSWKSQGGTW